MVPIGLPSSETVAYSTGLRFELLITLPRR